MMRVRARARELRSAGEFLRGLGPFLARPAASGDPRARLERRLAERESAFADLLRLAVHERPGSPYRRLLAWAGVTPGDIESLLATEGLETTLEKLHDAGVRLSLEEFKGRSPIARPGLDLDTHAGDFDNPLTRRHYAAQTGGSTGAARAVLVDLDLLEHESAYHALFLAAAGATGRPVGIWHLAPPGAVGLKCALIQARLGQPAERWFAQNRLQDSELRHALFTRAALLASRLAGAPLPTPEFAPARAAARIARWLAQQRDQETPALLSTTVSGGVRVCAAALDEGLDIRDTLFVLVGEPYTAARAEVVARTSSRAFCHYAMTEAGLIGLACCAAGQPDAVHLLDDKVATIERPRRFGSLGVELPALVHTTLHPASPKLMINVESGDTGVREPSDCGCGALPAGFRTRLHTIRSYEKLTSEGMHLLGVDLLGLVEDHLPATFGGRPTDYQLLERERDGLPVVSLLVRPEVGELDERRVVESVLAFLRARGAGQRLMADVWKEGQTLRVLRDAPHATAGGKIPALRTLAE